MRYLRVLFATLVLALSGCNLIAYDLTASGRDLSPADAGVEPHFDAGPADTGGNETDAGPTDPCLTNNGGCAAVATCASSAAGVTCTCPEGYTGNGIVCDDIEECLAANHGGCDVNATCTNLPGSYRCDCKTGYQGDGKTCSDIDECDTNNGGCVEHSTCTNTIGGHSCDCLPGYNGNGEFECWLQPWSQVATLPQKNFNFAGALAGDRLYLTGGLTSGTISTSVWMTELQSNGGATPVATLLSMPGPRMNHCSVAVGNFLYVIGGTTVDFTGQQTESFDVLVGALKPDGTVDSWRTTTAMASTRTKIACVAVGNRIYLIGGSTNVSGNLWSVVETLYATVDTITGDVDTWQPTTDLPAPLSDLAIGVVGDTLYVSGGLNTQGNTQLGTYYAKVQSDGALSDWTATNAPTINLYGARHFALGNKLYVIGHGGQVADVNVDGSLSSWSDTTPTFDQGWWRNNHIAVGHAGRAFVSGGLNYNGGAILDDILMQELP